MKMTITKSKYFDAEKAEKILRSNLRTYGVKRGFIDILMDGLEAMEVGESMEVEVPLVKSKNWS